MFKSLIEEMIDGGTLPKLTGEEVELLSEDVEQTLVQHIYEVFAGGGADD